MECQDVRQLLAFHERASEDLDAAERDAIQKHLDTCPECASLAQSQRSADQAIGAAMRAVAVPAGAKSQLLKRLAAERGGGSWSVRALAAAAAIVIATTAGSVYWTINQKLEFVLVEDDTPIGGWKRDSVQQHLAQRGLTVTPPSNVRYDLLRRVEIVQMEGRPVAKLNFVRQDGMSSIAVYIVDTRYFDPPDVKKNQSMVILDSDNGFVYCYLHPGGNTDWLRPPVF